MAGDPHVMFFRDIVLLGHGWRQRWMAASSVGSHCGSCDGAGNWGVVFFVGWNSSPQLVSALTFLLLTLSE
jgi:hypothetical protein